MISSLVIWKNHRISESEERKKKKNGRAFITPSPFKSYLIIQRDFLQNFMRPLGTRSWLLMDLFHRFILGRPRVLFLASPSLYSNKWTIVICLNLSSLLSTWTISLLGLPVWNFLLSLLLLSNILWANQHKVHYWWFEVKFDGLKLLESAHV